MFTFRQGQFLRAFVLSIFLNALMICGATFYTIHTMMQVFAVVVSNQQLGLQSINVDGARRDVVTVQRLEELSKRMNDLYDRQQDNIVKIMEIQDLMKAHKIPIPLEK